MAQARKEHQRNFGYFSLRSGTYFLIAGLHAALFYGLITTLSHTRGLATPPNFQNTVLDPVPPKPVPPVPGTERQCKAAEALDSMKVRLNWHEPALGIIGRQPRMVSR
jgi:hypothetical protein